MNSEKEIATFAGGCFWCTEAIFKRLKGVESVDSGYTGGKTEKPNYEEVSSGQTGYAEAVQVTFNPSVISYETLLDIFFATHDPTTLNRQGYDIGTQYRSAIFYHNDSQKEIAKRFIEKLEKEGTYQKRIVTEVAPFEQFYSAEDYHKNYYDINRDKPYCTVIIDPKIQKLLREYKKEVKEEYLKA